jgi:RsiW-degrading membrane proteinase PrsW (M82 family)
MQAAEETAPAAKQALVVRAGEGFANVIVDPRSTKRTLLVAGVLVGLMVLATGFFGNELLPLLVALALVPVAFWVPLALWVDRHEPEPRWLVFISFVWGASVAVAVAYVFNTVGGTVVSLEFGDEVGDIYGGSISAPIVEESAKGAVLFLIFWRRRKALSGILDALVYATMVGLGFAMVENVLYYAKAEGITGAFGSFVLRGALTPLAHPIFTSMTAIGLVVAARSQDRRVQVLAPIAGLLGAIGLHSLWNTMATAGPRYPLALVLVALFFLGLVILAIVAIAISMRREAEVIRTYLPDDVADDEEVKRLFRARSRVADAWQAFRTGGLRAVRARDDYVRSLSAIAFRNHREAVARGEARDRLDPVTDRYERQLRRLLDWASSRRSQPGAAAAEGAPGGEPDRSPAGVA